MEYAQRLLSTKKGAALAAALAALLSLALILTYVNRYRSSTGSAGAPAVVLVAKKKIGQGTPAEVIANKGLYELARIRHDQLAAGALTSPAALKDQVLTRDVYPGQQLAASDFGAATSSVASQLVDDQLAISLSLDNQHGLSTAIEEGDHVNVYVGYVLQTPAGTKPVVRLISQDVKVLGAEQKESSTGEQELSTFVLQARNAKEAATWAHAADNGKIWLALRPAASDTKQAHLRVDVDSILFGTPPVGGTR